MQQGGFSSLSYHQYPQNPHIQNPNPTNIPNSNTIYTNPNPNFVDQQPNPLPPAYASAPPFTTNFSSSDYSAYPLYPQNSDPVHAVPTAPSYSANPTLHSFNPSPQPPSDTPFQQQSYFPSYVHHNSAPNSVSPNPNPDADHIDPSYSSPHLSSCGRLGSSVPHPYENLYENSLRFDNDRYVVYAANKSNSGSDLHGKSIDGGIMGYDPTASVRDDDSYGDGVYAYDGGKVQPYGARGTSLKSSTWSGFDDYGRSISFPTGKDNAGSTGSPKLVRAVPKVDTQQDVKSGIQKFRVKLLPEGGSQSIMDVLCQIGLDGIHMLDPTSGRTLRIYPLDTVIRCDVTESSTFAFWAKSSVDIDPRRIRLQSNSYITNTLLDTVTAATVQLKEMGDRLRPTDSSKAAEQPMEKKKGFGDWMDKLKPTNEEKDHWVPDEAITKCTGCGTDFGAFVRRHHCRNCGDIFCNKCTIGRIALTADENAQPVRVCDQCMSEVTERLSKAKEAASKPAGLQSHEDLAKELQEEMERNCRVLSGSKSDGSGRQMREVECPACTVHLQVQVPSSGSETIECGVCQNPFLVGAH